MFPPHPSYGGRCQEILSHASCLPNTVSIFMLLITLCRSLLASGIILLSERLPLMFLGMWFLLVMNSLSFTYLTTLYFALIFARHFAFVSDKKLWYLRVCFFVYTVSFFSASF